MRRFGPYTLHRVLSAREKAELVVASGPNPRHDEHLALKRFREWLADEGFAAAMAELAPHLMALSHPSVAQVDVVGQVDGVWFVAGELVQGHSLAWWLNERAALGHQGLPPEVAADWLQQACTGVSAAHTRDEELGRLELLHLDLRPANLLVQLDGRVRVTGFGEALAAARSGSDRALVPRHLEWLAPEALAGDEAKPAWDSYALGVTLFHALTGRALFDLPDGIALAEAIRSAAARDWRALGVPDGLTSVLDGALALDASKRPTVAALGQQLEAFLAGAGLPDDRDAWRAAAAAALLTG
jgi:serine/threonine-protein kinase